MEYGKHRAPARFEAGEGCPTTLIRIPVRIVVLVIVLPVRLVRDALVAGARAADRVLLRLLGRALSRLLRTAVRRDVWRALVGGPGAPEPREPGSPLARTLGVTQQPTTVPCAAPEPEISSLGEKNAERG